MAWSKKYRYANGSENCGPGGTHQGNVQSGDEGQLRLCGYGSPGMSCDRYSGGAGRLVALWRTPYLATKVSFVNEFRRICEILGADWHTVREGWLLDPRVEPAHRAAFASTPGFGGRCLPKDLSAIIPPLPTPDIAQPSSWKCSPPWSSAMARWRPASGGSWPTPTRAGVCGAMPPCVRLGLEGDGVCAPASFRCPQHPRRCGHPIRIMPK